MIERCYYLVATTHRTGSNLLTQHLRETRIAGLPLEHFSPAHIPKIVARHGFTSPEVSLTAYIDDLKNKFSTANGVFGTKIMWPHLAAMIEQWKKDPQWETPVTDNPWEMLMHFFPKAQMVWLRRDDKLRQAISMARAKQTEIYSSVQLETGSRTVQKEPEYDFELIYDNRRRLTRSDDAWGKLFEDAGITPFVLHYEEMCKDPRGAVSRLIKEMGFPGTPQTVEMTFPNSRISDAINDQWYEKFLSEEVVQTARLEKLRAEQRFYKYYQSKWLYNNRSFSGKFKNTLNHFLGKEPPGWKKPV